MRYGMLSDEEVSYSCEEEEEQTQVQPQTTAVPVAMNMVTPTNDNSSRKRSISPSVDKNVAQKRMQAARAMYDPQAHKV